MWITEVIPKIKLCIRFLTTLYVFIAVEDRRIAIDNQQENITCVIKQQI